MGGPWLGLHVHRNEKVAFPLVHQDRGLYSGGHLSAFYFHKEFFFFIKSLAYPSSTSNAFHLCRRFFSMYSVLKQQCM